MSEKTTKSQKISVLPVKGKRPCLIVVASADPVAVGRIHALAAKEVFLGRQEKLDVSIQDNGMSRRR